MLFILFLFILLFVIFLDFDKLFVIFLERLSFFIIELLGIKRFEDFIMGRVISEIDFFFIICFCLFLEFGVKFSLLYRFLIFESFFFNGVSNIFSSSSERNRDRSFFNINIGEVTIAGDFFFDRFLIFLSGGLVFVFRFKFCGFFFFWFCEINIL